MPITNQQKQEIARCFAENISFDEKNKCATLCRFRSGSVIQFKYHENRGAIPGLAIYALNNRQQLRHDINIEDFEEFRLNVRQRDRGDDIGYIAFYRVGCETQQDVYAQIVSPGTELKEWKRFYEYLKEAVSKLIGQLPEE